MNAEVPGLDEARLAVTAAAMIGDAGNLYHIVSGLLSAGMPFDAVLFDVLTPVGHDIGLRWEQGDCLVSEEHAATAAIETLVSLLAGSFDQPHNGRHIVVAAAEGDTHSLPPRLIAAHLLALEHRTVLLGGDVLASDLREYLDDEPPDAVVLSCAMTSHLLGAREVIRASHAAGAPVLAGGAAFGQNSRRATMLGADAWAPTGRDVPHVLASWDPDPRAAEAGAAEPSEELAALTERRVSVIAAAQEELTARGLPAGEPRLTTEISLLLGAVEGWLLVGDDEVIADMHRWQETTLAAHGYDVRGAIPAALHGALASVAPVAAQALARATGATSGR